MICKSAMFSLRCDGVACKKCNGPCTNTVPDSGSIYQGGCLDTRAKVVRELRRRAKAMGWMRHGKLTLCPDCGGAKKGGKR